MNVAAIAILSCLWAQAPGESDQYEPQLRPAQKAPPVELEETGVDDPQDAPAADAEAMPARHSGPRHAPAAELDEPAGEERHPAREEDESSLAVDQPAGLSQGALPSAEAEQSHGGPDGEPRLAPTVEPTSDDESERLSADDFRGEFETEQGPADEPITRHGQEE